MKTGKTIKATDKTIDKQRGPSFDDLPDSALIRQAQLIPAILPVSAGTLWNMVKDGRIEGPVRIPGGRITAWRVASIRKFLQSLTA